MWAHKEPPRDIYPFANNVVARPVFVVLIVIVRHTSAITIRETWEKNVSLHIGPGGHTACLGPHSEVTRREREREKGSETETGPGVLLLLGLRVGCLWSHRSTLYC